MVRFISCIPDIFQTFIMKGCWILSKGFLIPSDMIMCFHFSFQIAYMGNYMDKFSYVEPSLQLWDKALLVIVDDLFVVFLDFVWKYFI